jgi:hypothetical protein
MSPGARARTAEVAVADDAIRYSIGNRTIVVADTATNRDLEADVATGRSGRDLLYRLGAAVVELPPLRDWRGCCCRRPARG